MLCHCSEPQQSCLYTSKQFFKNLFEFYYSISVRFSQWSLSFIFRHQNPVCIALLPDSFHMPRQSPFHLWFDHPNNIYAGVQTSKLLALQSSPVHCYFTKQSAPVHCYFTKQSAAVHCYFTKQSAAVHCYSSL